MLSQPAGRGRRRRRLLLVEVSLMLAGGLVGHAVTAVVTAHLLGSANPSVHEFRPGAAVVGVVLAALILGRHHMVERRASNVMAFRVLVGQQTALVGILALEWTTAGRVDQLAHDPWLWTGATLQLVLVLGWRLLEHAVMATADGIAGVPVVRACEVVSTASAMPRRHRARGAVIRLSPRAPPAAAMLLGPTG